MWKRFAITSAETCYQSPRVRFNGMRSYAAAYD
jgi:hypothetical protein